jgi:hypothetical protein
VVQPFVRDKYFDLYFILIALMDFPSGIPMTLSAHQPQHQLADRERSNLRCGHESHSQNNPFPKASRCNEFEEGAGLRIASWF